MDESHPSPNSFRKPTTAGSMGSQTVNRNSVTRRARRWGVQSDGGGLRPQKGHNGFVKAPSTVNDAMENGTALQETARHRVFSRREAVHASF